MNKFLKEIVNPFTGLGKSKKILGNIGGNLSATISLLSRPKKPTENETSLEQVELKARYRNARLTAFVLLAMLSWASVNLLISKTMLGFMLSSICTFGVGTYYLALCKILYTSRLALLNWSEREQLSVTWLGYFNAIAENPKNVFPRNIKH